MRQGPKISIIIPLYNKEKSIKGTLQSVLEQTYGEYEVLVVDDGSTDDSYERAWDVVDSDDRFSILRKKNSGVCSARNEGIRKARYDLIAFLDADDLWDKDYLEEQVKLYCDYPECAMWGINYAETNEGKPIRQVPTGLEDGFRGIVKDYFHIPGRISDLFCSSSVLIRRNAFQVVGMFDERIMYSEDSDMWFRIIARFPVCFYDKCLVYYQFDAENRALNRQRLLRYFLPYFVDKYEPYKDAPAFYEWIHRWSAQHLAKYYFCSEQDFNDAKCAIAKLDYSIIPFKYKLFFKTPYLIGMLAYRIVVYLHKNGLR